MKKAEEYKYSFDTVKRARKELKDSGKVENYATGSAKKGDRVWYIRLKPECIQDFDLLPMDEPVPFDGSA